MSKKITILIVFSLLFTSFASVKAVENQPDLITKSITENVAEGSISVVVKNNGSGSADVTNSIVRVLYGSNYYDRIQNCNPDDTACLTWDGQRADEYNTGINLGAYGKQTLSAGEEYSLVFSMGTTPGSEVSFLPGKTYMIKAYADFNNGVSESNENNNTFEKTITVSDGQTNKPDLIIENFKFTSNDVNDQGVNNQIEFYMKNVGAVTPTQVFNVTVENLTNNTVLYKGDFNGIYFLPNNYSSHTYVMNVLNKNQLVNGNNKIRISIDVNNSIAETDESNNTLEKIVTAVVANNDKRPDLAVTGASLIFNKESKALAGTVTIANIGGADAISPYNVVGIWMDINGSEHGWEQLPVESGTNNLFLKAGQKKTFPIKIKSGNFRDGTNEIIFYLDRSFDKAHIYLMPDGYISEVNETNNKLTIKADVDMSVYTKISGISGAKQLYSPGELINLKVKAITIDGKPAASELGYHIQYYTYDANDSNQYLQQYIGSQQYNAYYNNGYWEIKYNAPQDNKKYYTEVILYCSRENSACWLSDQDEFRQKVYFQVSGNSVESAAPQAEETPASTAKGEFNERANLMRDNKIDIILREIKKLRDIIKEQQTEINYLNNLVKGVRQVNESIKQTLNNFITYGVDANTVKLGAGERAAVIHSYKAAFAKLPETEAELADTIKIANGRFPSLTSDKAEKQAKDQFIKIYKRIPDLNDAKDNAAIKVMAYGLRQKAENRNLNSEKIGINIFKSIYGYVPKTTEDWNAMQAITYSGSSRGVDTDGDLLTDDREAELGTDPNNPDTDGDGYPDGVEVANGYNPKGEGKL